MKLRFKLESYEYRGKKHYWHTRQVYDGRIHVGSVDFVKDNRWVYIMHIEIFEEYRGNGYAEEILRMLLNRKKVDCVVGETLEESRGFWSKMIRKYNGSRRNITYYNDTTSSFVIPKNNITNSEMYKLFDKWDKL